MVKRTERITLLGALLGAALCVTAGAAQAASVNVGSATGAKGTQVTFSVSLTSAGAQVAGTQNDIAFDNNTPAAAFATKTCLKTSTQACSDSSTCPLADPSNPSSDHEPCVTRPDCTASAAGKSGFFSFISAPGCTPGGPSDTPPGNCECSGTGCTAMRAIIASLDTSPGAVQTAITDGPLYSCKDSIASNASAGDHALTAAGVVLSDPNGATVSPATGNNGKITVTAGVTCIGDLDSSGDITANEVVLTIKAFAQDDVSLNPAADGDNSGSVEAGEVVRVILNFAKDECNP